MATLTERRTRAAEERANIDIEQRSLLDTAAGENRGLTAEERTKDDQLSGRFDELSDELRRIDRQIEREGSLRSAAPPVVTGGDEDGDEQRTSGPSSAIEARHRAIDSDEYRSALDTYLREGRAGLSAEQRSTLNVGTATEGGFTAPQYWLNRLIESAREFSAIREHAEVIVTEGGNKLHIPRVSTNAAAVTIVPEGTLIPDDAEEFDEVQLDAFKYAKIVKASDEFGTDTGVTDLAGFVSRRASEDIALFQGAHLAIGTGSSQPQGLISGAPVGKTTVSATAFTADEVIDLTHSVLSPYRPNGRYFANDLVIAYLRKLKDGDGNYIWQIGIKEGEPDRLLGKPIHAEPFMSGTLATTNKILGFGDVNRAYAIRLVNGVEVKYLDQRYAELGLVAWRVQSRMDADIKDTQAFKTMRLA